MSTPQLVVWSHQLHTRGGIASAFHLAKREDLPIQHMRPDGAVVVVWYYSGKRKQRTHRDVRVIQTGLPFFLSTG